jgi:putative sporulation protein YtaF
MKPYELRHIFCRNIFSRFKETRVRIGRGVFFEISTKRMIRMVLTIAALAISLSLDSFGVGIAYGMRKVNIPLVSKLMICFFSILYSGMAIAFGGFLCTALPPAVSKAAGISILAGMGVYILVQALRKTETAPAAAGDAGAAEAQAKKTPGGTMRVLKDPEEGDLDRSGVIDIRESLLLGLALSIDAIGVGIGSSLAGLGSAVIPFAIGLCQLLFLYAGIFLGRKAAGLGRLNKKAVSLAPGLLLLTLALLRIR